MRLLVRHETIFDYDEQPAYAVQRLYLTPPSFASQRILNWKITAPGIDKAVSHIDGFGNRVHLVTYGGVKGPVAIIAEGEAECTDAAGVIRGLPSPAPDAVFLRQTRATTPSDEIAAMATASLRPAALDTLHAIMAATHARVSYEIGTTDAHTTAAEAFADGHGVCQDHAHILAGAARHIGIPARYVTGYLVTADGASPPPPMPGPRPWCRNWAGWASMPPTTAARPTITCAWRVALMRRASPPFAARGAAVRPSG